MYDLDHSLRALAAQPIPAHLAMIDEAVFAGLEAHRREVGAGSRLMGLAGAFALVLGVISGTLAESSLKQSLWAVPLAGVANQHLSKLD